MGLDINTPKGHESQMWEEQCMTLLKWHTRLRFSKTHEPCEIDGILTDTRQRLRYVVEQKSRQMTYAQLFGSFQGEWLLTATKLTTLREAARLLHAPAIGVLYLVPDETVMVIRLSDATGVITAPIRYDRTTTPATINGGTAVRENAYIDMRDATVYRGVNDITAQDLTWF